MTEAAADSLLHGLPQWARTIAVIGFPAVAAAFLMYYLAQNVSSEIKAQTTLLQTHTVQGTVHDARVSDFLTDHARSEDSLKAILQAMCANAADTAQERKGCFPVPPVP
jgi:hypothetical protein